MVRPSPSFTLGAIHLVYGVGDLSRSSVRPVDPLLAAGTADDEGRRRVYARQAWAIDWASWSLGVEGVARAQLGHSTLFTSRPGVSSARPRRIVVRHVAAVLFSLILEEQRVSKASSGSAPLPPAPPSPPPRSQDRGTPEVSETILTFPSLT